MHLSNYFILFSRKPDISFVKIRRNFVKENSAVYTHTHTHIQGDSRLVDITAGGDFLGLCDQKSSYKHVSDF